MGLRVGLGPVFYYEWLVASRRWQLYAGRALFLLVVLAVLFFVWWAHVSDVRQPSIQDQARLGTNFFFAIVTTQLALVLLAAPAATAGSVCLDKARGTLAHLLVTDLSSAELILGKLAARLLPVLSLLLCLLPVLALNVLLGGVDPVALASAFLITVGVAVLGCSLALLLSVWGHKTHEVLLFNYLLWALFLLAYPLYSAAAWGLTGRSADPALLRWANPFWLTFAPYDVRTKTGLLDGVAYFALCLGLAAVFTGLAILTVRRVTVHQLGRAESRPGRLTAGLARRLAPWAWFGPSLDGDPVLWREWHRRRPSRWVAIVWLVFALLGGSITLLALYIQAGSRSPTNELAVFGNGVLVAAGLLLVSVSSSTSLAEERVRGSLDVLLATPLTTRAVVAGKWWGAYRTVVLMAVLPGLLAAGLFVVAGPTWEAFLLVPLTLAYGAALTSLGLAVATWVPRLGRAVGCTVVAYVLMTVAYPMAVLALFARDEVVGPFLAVGSPFFGPALLTARMQERAAHDLASVGPGAVLWTFLYLGAAAVLYVAALRTFDRCLGRMTAPDRDRGAGWPPPSRGVRRHAGEALPGPQRVADGGRPVVERGE